MDNIIGFTFRGPADCVYLCTRYAKRPGTEGFIMRLLFTPPGFIGSRKVGEEVCVSPRAIGATYHYVDQSEKPSPHRAPCHCGVCP